jgi:predicted DNA-binding transcriptional regulator AlpA
LSSATEQFLDITQARAVLPMSVAWYAQARCKRTGPPYFKIGQRVFYRRSDLVAWVERHEVRPKQPAAPQEAQ